MGGTHVGNDIHGFKGMNPNYDPTIFPLVTPHGEILWFHGISHQLLDELSMNVANWGGENGNHCSCQELAC